MSTIAITVHVTNAQAEALAQLVKRIGWSELRINAIDDDEARMMMDSVLAVQKALADSGYAPR